MEISLDDLRANGLLATDAQARRLADEYRAIKWPLLNNARLAQDHLPSRANLIMVASALSGEGKTFTCVNLCLNIARERDWSVVLVDGDCSKAGLTAHFGLRQRPGLMDILRDPSIDFENYVLPTNIPGLALLPAGTRSDDDAAELLSSSRMEEICATLAASDPRRLVVFDSPPLLLTPEATILGSRVGQIVLVVLADSTPQRAVLAARDKLDQEKAISLVLNQASPGNGSGTYGTYGYGDFR